MAGPITWRNVGSTVSSGGSAPLMQGAQDSIDSGFSALNKALERRQQTQAKNFGVRQNNQSADYLDRIAQAGNVDELNALRESEELAQLRQGLVGSTRDEIRGALDKQETNLMERTRSRDSFGDEQWMRNNQDKLAAIEAQVINGDLEGGVAAAEELGIPDAVNVIRGFRDSYNTSADQRIQQGQFGLAQNRDARAGEIHDTRMNDWQEGEDAEDRTRALNVALNRAAAGSEAGSTADRQAFMAEMREQFPDLAQSEVNTLREGWDARTSGQFTLSTEDRLRVDNEVAQYEREYDMANNPIAQTAQMDEQSVLTGIRNLLQTSKEKGYLSEEGDDDVLRETGDKMFELAMDGYTDSQGRRVPVPLEAFAVALETSGDDLLESDTKFKDRIKEIMQQPGFKRRVEEYGLVQDLKQQAELKAQVLSGRRQPTN